MRKTIISLLLVVALSLNGVMMVRAEGCVNHEWISGKTWTSYQGFGSQSDHNKIVTQIYECNNCDATKEEKITLTEGHDYYLYDNLGHQDGYHKYRIYCRNCNESYIITLICDNRDGHATPWSYSGEEVK